MSCELLECCRFFDDHMRDLPAAAELYQRRLCRGDFHSCTRYQIYKSLGDATLPPFLNANDLEQVHQAARCLAERQGRLPRHAAGTENVTQPEEPRP